MFYALLCILIYVTIRFDYRYSPGAVLALFHDSVITLGVFIITQKQFDLADLGRGASSDRLFEQRHDHRL